MGELNLKIVDAHIVTESEDMAAEIEKTIQDIQSGHLLFVSSFARLGTQLNEVRRDKLWEQWGHPSFGAYIKSIETRIKKGRSQIYGAISVAERLLPYTSENEIEEMGISKATELSKMVKLTGAAPSNSALSLAKNPLIETEELKAFLYEESHVQKLDERGKYRDLGGFFATDEEWAEIQLVFELGSKIDPVISQETSEWMRRKEIIFRLIRSVRIEWEHEAKGYEQSK